MPSWVHILACAVIDLNHKESLETIKLRCVKVTCSIGILQTSQVLYFFDEPTVKAWTNCLTIFQYSIDNIAVREIQYAMLHRKIIFLNCATFLGISVSSKTDGVIVLHLPIEDRGDKVSLSILWKY